MRFGHGSMIILGCLVLLLACAPSAPAPAAPAPPAAQQAAPAPRPAERTMGVILRVEPVSIVAKPLSATSVKIKFSTRLFNAALDLIDDRGVAHPYLAEALPQLNTDSWRVFPDGRMETRYRLKPNLVWHDGAPLTAADFVMAWRVYTTAELTAAASPPQGLMDEVVAEDPLTLVIKWRRLYPRAGVLQDTSGGASAFPPLPRHLLEASYQEGQWDAFAALPYWTREFVGAGPYRLERWEPGASIEGVAFDRHVLGRPKIDRVRLVFNNDANAALASLLSDAVQFATDSSLNFQQGLTARREWFPKNGGTLILTTDLFRGTYFQFRPDLVTPHALLDVRVRRALAHAMDRKALNDALYEGEGVMAETIASPLTDYYPTIERGLTRYPVDVRRAEQLMNEAGYSKGADGIYASPTEGRLTFELKVNASTQYEAERSIMASIWRQAGFDVTEAVLPAAQAQDNQARSTYPGLYSFSTGLGDSAVPNFMTSAIPRPETRWTGNNRGGWSSTDYDRLADTYQSTLDPPARIQQLGQLVRLISDELPTIALYYDLGVEAHTSAIVGPRPVSPDTSGLVAWNVHEWEMK